MTRLSFSRAWDETRAILARDGRLIWPLGLMTLVVPQLLISTVVGPAALVGLSPDAQGAASGSFLLALLLVALARFGGLTAIAQLSLRSNEQVGDALRLGLRRAPALLGAALLVLFPLTVAVAPALLFIGRKQAPSSGAALLFLLGVVVGLIVFARLQFAMAVAASEGGNPIRLLVRSWRASAGNTLRLIAFVLLFLGLLVIISLALNATLGSLVLLTLGRPEPLSVSALLLSALGLIGEFLVLVPFAVMLARLYAQVGRGEPRSVPHAP